MPTITINGQTVTVGDDFMKLSQDQQHATIDEIASKLPKQQPPEETSAAGELFKSFPTGIARTAAQFARGEQIESEQRAMAFTDKPNAGPAIPTGEDVEKTFGLHSPQGFWGGVGELGGELAVNPLSYLGPETAATKALMAGGAALGGSAGQQVGKGTAWEPLTELLGIITGGVGAAGTARAAMSAASPRSVASADLSRALERDGDTPQAIIGRLRQARQVRPNATVADVGGENVRGLVERVAQTPGAGRQTVVPALTERQQGQLQRISGDLGVLLGNQRSALQAVDSAIAERAGASRPLYEAAYNAGDRALWSPELERLSSSPTVKAAMGGAVNIWRDNVIADGFGAMNPGASVERGGQLEFLSGKVPVFPNLQFWDYTKRLLDDQVRVAVRAGENQKARTLTRLVTQLRNELDRVVPEYQPARSAWEGPTAYIESIEAGRNILATNESPEEMAANFAAMSDANKDGYRIGALSAIRAKMGNDAGKMADMTKYLRSPAMREKVATMMPTPEAAASWRRRLGYEVSSSELTGRALGNSATARRLAEREDADSLVGDLVRDAILHGPAGSFWWKAIMAAPTKLRDTLRSRTDRVLAEQTALPQPQAATESALAPPSGLTPGYVNPAYAVVYGATPATSSLSGDSPLAAQFP